MKKKKSHTLIFPSAKKYIGKDGEYFLADPQDFKDYLELSRDEVTERHADEFHLRMITHFYDSVFEGKKPKEFVLIWLAQALYKVSMGGRWEDEIQLPWTAVEMPMSPSENKDLSLFCEISNYLNENPTSKITDAITLIAEKNFVSYEKAKSAYYKNKRKLED